MNILKPYVDSQFTDPYGTAVGVINANLPFKVVIEAHADEISWFVNYVTPEGLMYVKRNGGVDPVIAPAQRVIIHGKKGTVKAVFGWPAIHTRSGIRTKKNTLPKIENLWLDCGARNRKEVEALGIHIGAVVTYTEGLMNWRIIILLAVPLITGSAVIMIAEVARLLKENKKKLPFRLICGECRSGRNWIAGR